MGKRVLLINPPALHTAVQYPDEDGNVFLEPDDYGHFPPLGMLYVAAYLREYGAGHQVHAVDCVAEHADYQQLATIIEAYAPDVVGITSFSIGLVDVVMTAELVRELCPGTHICMGGHHPIAFPFEAAQLDAFDTIVVGEGEVAFTRLVDALEHGDDYTEIPGVYTQRSIEAYRGKPLSDRRFLTNVMVPPAYIDDLDTLPLPARDLVSHIHYNSIVGVTGKLATIISSRGCPYLCTFCDVPYKKYRERDVCAVVDEIEACMALGYKEFHFYDDLFNIQPTKITAISEEILRRGLNIVWDFRGRVNTVTRESLAIARKSGLRMATFGVETGSDEALKALKKGTTVAKVQQAFAWCRELGIRTIADYMIGFPWEKTPEDVHRSIDFLIALDPDYAQISVLTLFPNTPLFNDAIDAGLLDPRRWLDFALDPKPGFVLDHWEEHMSTAELVRLQRESYRRFYLRPRYIARSVRQTRTVHEFRSKVRGLFTVMAGAR